VLEVFEDVAEFGVFFIADDLVDGERVDLSEDLAKFLL
jgi:hypothetical protein